MFSRIYYPLDANPRTTKRIGDLIMEDKKYIVVRYFDTYPDGVQVRNLDYQSAKKIADELNCKNNRPYVEYLVRDSSEDDKRGFIR